uniref:Uncharacterized protein n=1 Tax=Arundo donax TaxID=35708 RepID=A0A0A9DAW1_ARUDO
MDGDLKRQSDEGELRSHLRWENMFVQRIDAVVVNGDDTTVVVEEWEAVLVTSAVHDDIRYNRCAVLEHHAAIFLSTLHHGTKPQIVVARQPFTSGSG